MVTLVTMKVATETLLGRKVSVWMRCDRSLRGVLVQRDGVLLLENKGQLTVLNVDAIDFIDLDV